MTVAKFREEKGYEYLVEAMRRFAGKPCGIKFVFIGDGPLLELIKLKAERLDMKDRIFFLGYKEDVQEFLPLCDIFVLPSVSEGFAMSLAEAMAMERPVVATAAGGIPEVVTDGENGLLVAPRDAEALFTALDTLASDEKSRNQMGRRGRERVEEKFDVKNKVKELEGIYLACLGR